MTATVGGVNASMDGLNDLRKTKGDTKMGILNSCKPATVNGKVATKDSKKGCTIVYLVDANGNAIPGGQLMRIGNKSGHIFLEKDVHSKFGFDLTYKGELKLTTKLAKAVRCR